MTNITFIYSVPYYVVTGLSTCLIVSKEVGNTLIMLSVFVHMLRLLIDWFLD